MVGEGGMNTDINIFGSHGTKHDIEDESTDRPYPGGKVIQYLGYNNRPVDNVAIDNSLTKDGCAEQKPTGAVVQSRKAGPPLLTDLAETERKAYRESTKHSRASYHQRHCFIISNKMEKEK